jgi:hypothetical protein
VKTLIIPLLKHHHRVAKKNLNLLKKKLMHLSYIAKQREGRTAKNKVLKLKEYQMLMMILPF